MFLRIARGGPGPSTQLYRRALSSDEPRCLVHTSPEGAKSDQRPADTDAAFGFLEKGKWAASEAASPNRKSYGVKSRQAQGGLPEAFCKAQPNISRILKNLQSLQSKSGKSSLGSIKKEAARKKQAEPPSVSAGTNERPCLRHLEAATDDQKVDRQAHAGHDASLFGLKKKSEKETVRKEQADPSIVSAGSNARPRSKHPEATTDNQKIVRQAKHTEPGTSRHSEHEMSLSSSTDELPLDDWFEEYRLEDMDDIHGIDDDGLDSPGSGYISSDHDTTLPFSRTRGGRRSEAQEAKVLAMLGRYEQYERDPTNSFSCVDPENELRALLAEYERDPAEILNHDIEQHWAETSRVIGIISKRACEGRLSRETALLFRRQAVIDIAVEAAVHGHWGCLYHAMLFDIRHGNGQRVIETYKAYRLRLFSHQGLSPTDIAAPDPATRRAARISSDGLWTLTAVYIAALVVTDRFDSLHIPFMLGGTRLMTQSMQLSGIKHALWAVDKGGNLPNCSSANQQQSNDLPELGTTLWTKYLGALNAIPGVLAMQHGAVFRERAPRSGFDQTQRLLKTALDFTVLGPTRLMRPVNNFATDYIPPWGEELVVTLHIWESLALLLCRHAQYQDFLDMVTQHLPNRGLILGPEFYARVMRFLRDESRHYVKGMTRKEALDKLNDHIARAGLSDADDCVAANIRCMSPADRAKNALALYHDLRTSPRDIGPETRAALIHGLFELGQAEDAVELLRRIPLGDPNVVQPRNGRPYRQFIISAIAYGLDAQRISSEVARRPEGCDLGEGDVIRLVMHQCSAEGMDAHTMVKRLIAAQPYHDPSPIWYRKCLTIAASIRPIQATHGSGVSAYGVRFISELVREYIETQSGVNSTAKTSNVLRSAIIQVITSHEVTRRQRHEFARNILTLTRERCASVTQPFMMDCACLLLARGAYKPTLSPDDNDKRSGLRVPASDDDTADALYWWIRMRRIEQHPLRARKSGKIDGQDGEVGVPGQYWNTMIRRLFNAGRPVEAQAIYASAASAMAFGDSEYERWAERQYLRKLRERLPTFYAELSDEYADRVARRRPRSSPGRSNPPLAFGLRSTATPARQTEDGFPAEQDPGQGAPSERVSWKDRLTALEGEEEENEEKVEEEETGEEEENEETQPSASLDVPVRFASTTRERSTASPTMPTLGMRTKRRDANEVMERSARKLAKQRRHAHPSALRPHKVEKKKISKRKAVKRREGE